MAVYALTGADDLIINDRPITEFTDNSTIQITFPNEKVGSSTGKNANTVFATNEQGRNVQVELRILAGGKDDAFLNGLSIQQERDLPSFTLMNGSFSKRVGDGSGNVKRINYTLLGGVISQGIDAQENLTGDTEQGTALYRMTFAQGARAII